MSSSSAPTPPTRTLLQRFARIAPYFREGRLGVLVAVIGSLIGAATEPLIPELMKPLLDEGFSGGKLPLWAIPVAIVGIFALRGIAGFVAQYALSWAAHRGVQALREALFLRILNAQPGMFTQQSASSLTNTLVYEVQGGAQQLVSSVLTLLKDSLTLTALLMYLVWLNWKLTLFVGVLFPAVAWVMRSTGRRLHRLTREGQEATDALGYVVEENVLAWRIVRLHGAEPTQARRFDTHALTLRRVMLKIVAASGAMTPLTQIFTALALSAVITVALWQSNSSGTTVGGFVSFITAMLMLVAPVKHLSDVMAPITRGLASVERGLELLDKAPAETGGNHRVHRAEGEIGLRDVTLRYRDDQHPALDGLSLQIGAGETVALVGPSGAGKSTLANLLPRFVEPSSGTVRLDGVPLADWDIAGLRRQFALVSQDVVLFNASVTYNVALGDPHPDPDRVESALKGAWLWDFVQTLPQGVDALIGHNGNQLSGGQRQRLAIARALYKDAPILILDEATSALDTESERAVQAGLETLMRGRTTLIIAHRLSTIEHADRIVVMEAGRVVEQGPHATLLAAGGLYARLHAMQFRS
ncbi:lipid A export permease/ATP-binding protein MsbA [Aquabacterium sp. OR-4]|uniref:lipid A export permease/ATP-binding protein MsbA n=1 Tax=Aquabacterium sp. OR-4 TaxID=2978127 RepID=UPI0021B20197|nr:lipid A export permease/ATP-binding protein MsbA [Aquabacterium sp. OR-4]MDT7834914.1 lipid A export permease/ATP-binding protein MsbA [Aquabacterium sp. OR-4]